MSKLNSALTTHIMKDLGGILTVSSLLLLTINSSVASSSISKNELSIEEKSTPKNTVEEVVVTAQKRPENVLNVPISINVIESQYIDLSNSENLQQLETAMPSVNFGRGDRKTRGEISIRGIGGFSRNIGTDARTVVYIDDIPQGRSSTFNVDLANIERIEVIRGPQGTLYGKNSIAGAIKIITKTPGDSLNSSIRISAGNNELRSIYLRADAPLSQNVKTQLQINTVDKAGFIDNVVTGKDLQNTNTEAMRLKFAYHPNKNSEFQAIIDTSRHDSNATNALALADDFNLRRFQSSTFRQRGGPRH